MGGKWPYSRWLVGCCRQDLFNIALNILVSLPSSFFSSHLVSVHVVHPYSSTDTIQPLPGRSCVSLYVLNRLKTIYLCANKWARLKNVIDKMWLQIKDLIHMYKEHLALDNLKWLTGHYNPTQPNQRTWNHILPYEWTTWTLTKRMEKKIDGNYKRMLRAILNESWRTCHKTAAVRPPTTHHKNYQS